MEPIYEDDKDLSECEAIIMKTIWDEGEDISLSDLTDRLREHYGKEYARTTLVTFLLRMNGKGFVKTYRIGRKSYVTATRSEEEYKQKRLEAETDFWYGGRKLNLFSALCQGEKIPEEDIVEMRRILDGMD